MITAQLLVVLRLNVELNMSGSNARVEMPETQRRDRMRRTTLLVMTACACALMFSVVGGSAEDGAQAGKAGAAAAAPAVPADAGGKATDMKGGCPADGSCCGAPECPHAAAGGHSDGARAEGGCPCMKNKQQKPAS